MHSRSRCLPGKSIGQIYMQTQRLLGQQSLGGNSPKENHF